MHLGRAGVAAVEEAPAVKAAERWEAMSAAAGGMDLVRKAAWQVERTGRKHYKWRRIGAQPRCAHSGRALPWMRKSGRL